jgi:hypothetical protein
LVNRLESLGHEAKPEPVDRAAWPEVFSEQFLYRELAGVVGLVTLD